MGSVSRSRAAVAKIGTAPKFTLLVYFPAVNMAVTADIMGQPFEKKGEKYLEVTDFKLDIEPERLHMQFDNLFNGDAALGNHMNNFLNENWSIIYKELKPSIADTFGAIFKEISNRIYSRIPYKNIVL